MGATNELRIERARRAVNAWTEGQDFFTEETEEVVTDIVTDLLHLAAERGVDQDTVLRVAQMHFEEESEKDE